MADLPIDVRHRDRFTPDGQWLMTDIPEAPALAGRHLARRRVPGEIGLNFSPDGRLTVVAEPSRIVRLVDFPTGRTLARLESPDLCGIAVWPSPRRLPAGADDQGPPGPVRPRLGPAPSARASPAMGLDWDAPAYPEPAPAAVRAAQPALGRGRHGGLRGLGDEAWSQLRQAGGLERPARSARPSPRPPATDRSPGFALAHNSLAWIMATVPGPPHEDEAVEHARPRRRARPGDSMPMNTLGVALYREGRFAEAVAVLERSLEAGLGLYDAFDLFFLAMAH